MKRYLFVFLLLSFASTGGLFAQQPTSIGPTDIKREPLVPKQNAPEKKAPLQAPKQKLPSLALPSFTKPGVISFRGGRWEGTDHLYNLTNQIGVIVEIVKPENKEIPFKKESIENYVNELFSANGLKPRFIPKVGPPLPFFNVVIMIIPAQESFAVYCTGRLFEEVDLRRINLEQGTYWQAITWEYQNLIFTPEDTLDAQVLSAIREITDNFIQRYKYFVSIKNQQGIN